MNKDFIAVTLGLMMFCGNSLAYAQDYLPEQSQNDNTVDVVVVNNSGQAITYVNNDGMSDSSCNIIFPSSGTNNVESNIIPVGGYFIAHATMGTGNGVVCEYNFTYGDNQNLHLQVMDPTYYYQGAAVYKMFLDTQQVVSSAYTPVANPTNDPTGLMDSSVTLILNSL